MVPSEKNMEHLAYCDIKVKELEKILIGSKTMLDRSAAGRKLPYARVSPGETIYLIENDGKEKEFKCRKWYYFWVHIRCSIRFGSL